MNIISKLYDNRSGCYSVMTEMTIQNYLELVDNVYREQGNISGQRAAIRTKSGKKIRDRMVDDIIKGAVLPPLVLGVISKQSENDAQVTNFLMKSSKEYKNMLSLIDGMQRTTAFKEAVQKIKEIGDNQKLKDFFERKIRVEFWVAKNTNNLLYRMLVLNTGQMPWNLRRQVEIIYSSLINDISENIPGIELIKQDENSKRSRAGQFPADKVIEMFLCFAARSENIDTKDSVTDEFARLDVIEASSFFEFNKFFYETLELLVKFDQLIFSYKGSTKHDKEKFRDGKDLFTSQPARIGFVTSISKYVFGLPGSKQNDSVYEDRMLVVKIKYQQLFEYLDAPNINLLDEFLEFDTLNEKLDVVTSKIGDFERKFFTNAFGTIFHNDFSFDEPTLAVCWRAA